MRILPKPAASIMLAIGLAGGVSVSSAQVAVQCPSLPCTITVTGPSIPPPPPSIATVSPLSLTFTAQLNTDSAIQFATAANPTSSPVAITSAFSAGPFTWGNIGTCNASVPANGSCTISIKYHPTSTAAATGSLTVTLAGKVTTVVLSGSIPIVLPALKPNLSWTPSGTAGVAGYNIYRSATSGGPYNKVNSAPVNGTAYVDASAPSGTWFYVATAIGSDGTESIQSNQIAMAVP